MKTISLTADEQKVLLPWLAKLEGIEMGLRMAQQSLLEQILKNRGTNENGNESGQPAQGE